jgi:diguanylate cyclase (GGDEF)-like protein
MQQAKLVFTILALTWLLAFPGTLLSQIEELGSPIITNYEPEQYKAHAQNWVAVQDRRGVMYFGNSNGILEFDGSKWELIPVGSYVRAMTCGPDGTIYYGSVGDFGYLAASPTGKIAAVSLKESIPPANRDFNDVWQAMSNRNGVYFFSREKIFRLVGGKVHPIAGKFVSSQACLLDDTLFYIDRERGFCLLEGDLVRPIPALSEIYQGKRVNLVPFARHQLLAGRLNGDFLRIDLSSLWDESLQRYDVSRPAAQDMVQSFPSELATFLPENRSFLYKLVSLDDGTFVISTIKNGIIAFDRSGKIIRVINTRNGLLDNTVLNVFFDRSGNLWAPNNSGISHIEYSPVQSYFGARNGINGISISVCSHNGRLYAGTYQNGSFRVPYRFAMQDDLQAFRELKNSPSEIWQFKEVSGDLMVVTSQGLQKIEGDGAFPVAGASANAYCMGTSRRWPDHIFVGLIGGLEVFHRTALGWLRVGRAEGVNDNIRFLSEDSHGDLWAGTDAKGLLRLHFATNSPIQLVVNRFGPEHGLPGLSDMRALYHGDTLYVVSPKGLFCTTIAKGDATPPERIRFTPDSNLGRAFIDPPLGMNSMAFDSEGGCFFNTAKGIYWAIPEKNGRYRYETRPFRGVPNSDEVISLLANGSLWLPGKSLFRFDPKARKDYDQSYDVLVRKVIANSKRIIFAGTHGIPSASFGVQRTLFVPAQNDRIFPEIHYRENALAFEFSASFYEKPGSTQFQYLLEGFDKEWSAWLERTSKEYTNLPEGSYRFRVRARNIYGTLGREASFRLRILPPWYRAWWAIILWLVSGVGALVGIILLYTRKLRRQKAHLESVVAERTQQLRDAALTDPLTGLRNRRFIMEVLKDDISAFISLKKHLLKSRDSRDYSSQSKVFGLFLMDIDFFKKVNDTYGHDAGDRVLKQFAAILVDSVRLDDTVLRTGGEEFLVVLKKTLPEYLPVYAKKILDRVAAASFEISSDLSIRKTCSIGFVSFPIYSGQPDQLSFEQSTMAADLAMYLAKNQGRNQAVCLAAGPCTPASEEALQKTVASLEFALKEGYLQISQVVPGPNAD